MGVRPLHPPRRRLVAALTAGWLIGFLVPAGAETTAIRIEEFSVGCVNGVTPSSAFVELRATSDGQTFDHGIDLVATDAIGRVLFSIHDVFASRAGQAFPADRTFLLATSGFATVTGVTADAALGAAPSNSGGAIVLSGPDPQGGARVELDRVDYGRPGDPLAPPPGRSLLRQPDGSLVESPYPAPRTFDGIVASGACYTPGDRALVVDELALQCRTGGTTGQFVELTNKGGGTYFDSDLGFRVLDHVGQPLGEIPQMFSANAGDYWPIRRTWLLASAVFAGSATLSPDATLPFVLDTQGGTIQILGGPPSARVVISSASYGGTASPLPLPGGSLQRSNQGVDYFVAKATPDPTNSAGQLCAFTSCFGVDTRAFFVDEVELACTDGGTRGQFIGLSHPTGSYRFDGDIGLRAFDHAGGALFDVPQVFASRLGTTWTNGRKFLVGSASLQTLTGRTADLVLPAPLDPQGGTVELYSTNSAPARVVWSMSYGPGTANALPPAGSSLGMSGSVYVVRPVPTPVNFTGLSLLAPTCHNAPARPIHINEVAVQCYDGGLAGQFIELQADASSTFGPDLGLRWFGNDGLERGALVNPWGAKSGAEWLPGRTFLLANPGFPLVSTGSPDAFLPSTFDRAGGRIELTSVAGPDTLVLETMRYGPGATPVPDAGASLARIGPLTFGPLADPTPTRLDQTVLKSPACLGQADLSIVLSQIGLTCIDGSPSGQFIELRASAATQFYATAQLIAFDHLGAPLFTIATPFGAQAGQPWVNGTKWLLANDEYAAGSALPDARYSGHLDPAGGTLRLVTSSNGLQRSVWSVSYGPGGAPPPGGSLESLDGTTFGVRIFPNPTNHAGDLVRDARCTSTAAREVHINELAFQCHDGGLAGQFVELTTATTLSFPDAPGLRYFGADGRERGVLGDPYGSRGTRKWAGQEPYLIAAAGFSPASSVAPDAQLPSSLDPAGGRVELFLASAGDTVVLESVRYGAGGFSLPAPGSSLERAGASFVVRSAPTPTGLGGAVAPFAGCLGSDDRKIVLSELGLTCLDGLPSGQFLELRASAATRFSADLRLDAFDRSGARIGTITHPFGALEGAVWASGTECLIADPGYAGTARAQPDATLPFPLDPAGGSLELYATDGSNHLSQWTVFYGGANPLPAAGGSLVFDAAGVVTAAVLPTPRNHAGSSGVNPSCSMTGTRSVHLNEFALQCYDGETSAQFFELMADAPLPSAEAPGIRGYGPDGVERWAMALPVGPLGGSEWPASRSYLLATTGLSTLTRTLPDATIPSPLDPGAGRFELFTTSGRDTLVLESTAWGPGDVDPPPAGSSLERGSPGHFIVRSNPSPTRYDRQGYLLAGCLGNIDRGARLSELGLTCLDGSPSAQFIELAAPFDTKFFADVHLDVLDHAGAMLGTIERPYGARTGTFWLGRQTCLIASAGYAAGATAAPDAALGFTMDPAGGTIVCYALDGAVRMEMWQIHYGTDTVLPPAGGSLTFDSFTSRATATNRPTPTNSAGTLALNIDCSDDASRSVHVAEFSLACADGGTGSQFLELSGATGDPISPAVGLRWYDEAGTLLGSLPGVFARLGNATWSTNSTFLVAATGLAPVGTASAGPEGSAIAATAPRAPRAPHEPASRPSGDPDTLRAGAWPGPSAEDSLAFAAIPPDRANLNYTADASLSVPLAPHAGRIEIVDRIGTNTIVLETIAYGTAAQPAPLPGTSLERGANGGYAIQPSPSPRNFAGVRIPADGCLGASGYAVVVQQLGLQCIDGSTRGQYVEFMSAADTRFRGDLVLRSFDRSGTLLATLAHPFAFLEGAVWRSGTAFLITAQDYPVPVGTQPDARLGAPLDTTGGRLELYSTSGDSVVVSMTYGDPLPRPGECLGRLASGGYVTRSPAPINQAGVSLYAGGCQIARPVLHLDEIVFRCLDGSTAGQYLRIRADSPGSLSSGVGLRILGLDNSVVADAPDLFGGVPPRNWPSGTTWLLTGPDYIAPFGLQPDGRIPARISFLGAKIQLYDLSTGSRVVLDQLDVSSEVLGFDPFFAPGPAVGECLKRDANLRWRRSVDCAPLNFSSQNLRIPGCHLFVPDNLPFLSEVFLGCGGTDGAGQFVALDCRDNPRRFATQVGLRVLDHARRVIVDRPVVFAGQSGANWPLAARWLVAAQDSVTPLGVAPDLNLALSMDLQGGTVQLYQPDVTGAPVLFDSLGYGAGGVALPGAGKSLQRSASGTWLAGDPFPSSLTIVGTRVPTGCGSVECPASIVTIPYRPYSGLPGGRSGSRDSAMAVQYTPDAGVAASFDAAAGTFLARGEAQLEFTDSFTITGVPVGTNVDLRARLDGTGTSVRGFAGGAPWTDEASVSVENADHLAASFHADEGPHSYFISVPVHAIAGTPFTLKITARAGILPTAWPRPTSLPASITGALTFTDYAPGLTIRSCKGFHQDVAVPVPTLVENASADAAPGRVSLTWHVRDAAGFRARVERTVADAATWSPIADVAADADGIVAFVDASVAASTRYQYRLAWTDAHDGVIHAGEVTVDVPRGLEFALFGARPNPSSGRFSVAFQLPRDGDVSLELLDVAGRRIVQRRELGVAGDHAWAVDSGDIRPGYYVLRLQFAGQVARRSVIVTR